MTEPKTETPTKPPVKETVLLHTKATHVESLQTELNKTGNGREILGKIADLPITLKRIPNSPTLDNFYQTFPKGEQSATYQISARELNGGSSNGGNTDAGVYEIIKASGESQGHVLKAVPTRIPEEFIKAYDDLVTRLNASPENFKNKLVLPTKYYVEGSTVFLWMPRMEKVLAKELKNLTKEEKILALKQAAETIDHLHESKVVNLDIKAENIYKSGQTNWQLGDFDTVKTLPEDVDSEEVSRRINDDLIKFTSTITAIFQGNPEIFDWSKNKEQELRKQPQPNLTATQLLKENFSKN